MKPSYLLLIPFPVWFLVGSLAVVGTVHAVERATERPYATCDNRAEPPLYRAALAPGQRAVLGDVSVTAGTNVSHPLPSGAIRVVLCGRTLTATVPKGLSVGMGGGLAGVCDEVGGRPHVLRCDVKPGSGIQVSALTVTASTPAK
jgi:hypothetical protein